MADELEPIEPSEAKEMYLDARKHEVSEATLNGYHYRLKHFIRWCQDVAGIDNMNNLSGRDLQRYKTWRRDDGDLKSITLEGQLDALRIFLRWCESIDAVEQGLNKKLHSIMPSLSKNDERRDTILEKDHAEELLDYLQQFEYASREHTILEILWSTGMRIGALYGLDVDDYDGDEERLEVRHRPESGTPLKNNQDGERMVALNARVCRVVEDWIKYNRHSVKDEYGREPLLTTEGGRMKITSIRENIYRITRPCYFANECPEDRDMDDCEATYSTRYSKCPFSVSPHDIRRGSITHYLTEDVPEKVVSDRMNVGQDVIDKHYDKRSEEVKVEQRRQYLDDF